MKGTAAGTSELPVCCDEAAEAAASAITRECEVDDVTVKEKKKKNSRFVGLEEKEVRNNVFVSTKKKRLHTSVTDRTVVGEGLRITKEYE